MLKMYGKINMNLFNKPFAKISFFIFHAIFSIFFQKTTLASRLSEEWIDLSDLSGEEKRQTQSLISKRKHFNNLMDDQKYTEALEYSKRILENLYHTSEDQEVFKDLKRGIQSISAMRQHFHSKIAEKEYAFARHYLTEKILKHPYHNQSDKALMKVVQKPRLRKNKQKAEDNDVKALTQLMHKKCFITSNIQINYQKQKKTPGFSKQFPFESSGNNYLFYINDLLPHQR